MTNAAAVAIVIWLW